MSNISRIIQIILRQSRFSGILPGIVGRISLKRNGQTMSVIPLPQTASALNKAGYVSVILFAGV